MPTVVSDIGGNNNEMIEHAASLLEKSEHRRLVFIEIYRGKQSIKSVDELTKATGLIDRRVLDAGKTLATNAIVEQTKKNKKTAYKKIPFFQHNRNKILNLANNSTKRKNYPTKRNGAAKNVVNLKIEYKDIKPNQIRANRITIDDIDSFSAIKKTARSDEFIEMPEKKFKLGVASILGEKGDFTDWGGELSDLYSSNLIIGGKRKVVAFAFKGPGKKGVLTPGKLGKNGDQIQRLFRCSAEVFFVQFWREIDHAVIEQMEKFAQIKSYLDNKTIYYGVIDGYDSTRLIKSYPNNFK